MSKLRGGGKLTEGSVRTLTTLLPASASLLIEEVSVFSRQNPTPRWYVQRDKDLLTQES